MACGFLLALRLLANTWAEKMTQTHATHFSKATKQRAALHSFAEAQKEAKEGKLLIACPWEQRTPLKQLKCTCKCKHTQATIQDIQYSQSSSQKWSRLDYFHTNTPLCVLYVFLCMHNTLKCMHLHPFACTSMLFACTSMHSACTYILQHA